MNYLKVLAILSLLFIFCGSVYGAGEADSPDINGVNAVIDDTITVENASYDKLITSNNCEEVVIGDNSIWDVPIREGPIVENDNTSIPDITLKGENGNNMSFNNPADVFINESFNFQMVFKNLGDATGFQPYIQLIAPDELTHFTVSYSNKKIVPIKVGVFNESTYDNTTGLYTLRDPFTKKEVHGPANSTFYILQYPLGSFTVDAPDAVLNITSGIGVLEIGKFASEDEINPDLLVTPIDANVVIIDEASMIDLFLMNYLMKALYSGTKLILVGDENQLPSVGPGNVLKDIIASEKVPVVTLNKIFRQAAKSKIILNSHKVNEGESFIGIKQENEEELLQDFFFIQENNKENIIKQIVSLCTGRLERYGNYDFIKNIQVITPTKKGNLGTKELNQVIQSNVNPFETTKKEKKFGDTIFRQGDRIMQIKNNYDIFWERDGKTNEAGSGVFNGEFGTIIDINEMDKEIVIKFDDDKKAWYSYADLDQIEHAYAITVHKAQRK